MTWLPPLAAAAFLTLLAALPAQATSSARQEDPPAGPRPEDVKRALDAGDLERAHELLTGLLLERRLERASAEAAAGHPEAAWEALQGATELAPRSPAVRALRAELGAALLERWIGAARELLRADRPREAMALLDEAVGLAPEDPRVPFLRGECSLCMGLEDGDALAFGDALASFEDAAGGLSAANAGAARALYLSSFTSEEPAMLERALELARRAREETPEGDEWAALMSASPPRTFAEIAFELYRRAKLAEAEPDRVAARFDECRFALEALLGRAPEDPWAWRRLANLLAWEARHDEAREVLLRALELAPVDAELHEGLVAASDALGGAERAIETYEPWVATHPDVALGHWWLGAKRLERAVARLRAGELEVEVELAAAEAALARCAELAPEHAERCAGYRALCRSALGRSRMERGDLAGARAALLSMEELTEGGLLWQYPGLWNDAGQPETGVYGLQRLIGRYMRTAADEAAPEEARNAALEEAAELAVLLHERLPEDADLANDAGFLGRDAGVALEQRAELLLRRSEGLTGSSAALPPEERARFRAEAETLLARAVRHMERSHAAYAAAAQLAPDDARVINDTAVILVHYLQRDLDAAEAALRRAIEVGTAELEAGLADEERRVEVTEAVGDAHENMGTLLLTLRGDATAALPWFERSLALAPLPRPIVAERHLPLCRAVLEGRVDVGIVERAAYWGALEPEKVLERIQADDELRRILRGERE